MMNIDSFLRGGICSYWFYRYQIGSNLKDLQTKNIFQ